MYTDYFTLTGQVGKGLQAMDQHFSPLALSLRF